VEETPAGLHRTGMLQTGGVAATIGPNDINLYASPLPDLLHEVSKISPVEAGTHVMLDEHGVRSTQRLAIGDVGGNAVVALWPAELKEQAKYLYGQRLGRPMIAAARGRGWTAAPSPHLAFRNSSARLRLYMAPTVDAAEYARRWEEGDLERVGAHSRADVRRDLWPWLKTRGYAAEEDDRVLEEWVASCLGQPAGVPAAGASAEAVLANGRDLVSARSSGARRRDPL
jgi:hypothetical protein